MNKPQIIVDAQGEPAFVVIPWADFAALDPDAAQAAQAMTLSDEELYARAKADGEEAFPIDVADRILAGDNPIKVYREYRRMTQKALAEAASISPLYLSQIETGKRGGSTKVLRAIASALNVGVDDLI